MRPSKKAMTVRVEGGEKKTEETGGDGAQEPYESIERWGEGMGVWMNYQRETKI